MGIEFGIPGVKPFVVQNLGKYERQAWQEAEFPSNGQNHLEEQRERESACRRFILDLYHAKPINGHAWIHGTKSGRMVHVGAVDAPETLADVNGHPRRNAAPHRVLGSRHVVQCFVAESNRILAVPRTRYGMCQEAKSCTFFGHQTVTREPSDARRAGAPNGSLRASPRRARVERPLEPLRRR